MTTQQPADGTAAGTDSLSRTGQIEELADRLSRLYDLRSLEVLETEEPGRAQEHHDAAYDLRAWLRGLPRREEKAAFERGWKRAMDRASRRIADLETAISSQQPGERPSPSTEWHLARQDPRYPLVRRELLALDTVTGEMALPYPLQELLALRLITALRTAEPKPAPRADG